MTDGLNEPAGNLLMLTPGGPTGDGARVSA